MREELTHINEELLKTLLLKSINRLKDPLDDSFHMRQLDVTKAGTAPKRLAHIPSSRKLIVFGCGQRPISQPPLKSSSTVPAQAKLRCVVQFRSHHL